MPDDVALHFRCACFDRVPAGSQVTVRPDAMVNRATVPADQLAVRAQQLLRDLLDTLIELAPKNLQDRSLRSGHASGCDPTEGTQLIQTHDFDLGVTLRKFLAHQRVPGGWMPVPLNCAGEFNQSVNVSLEQEMEARSIRAALVHERANSHIPAVVDFAEYVFDWHAHITEEELTEFALSGYLPQWTNIDSWRLHIDQQNRQSFMLRHVRVRANDKLAPIPHPAVAGPHFLTVDDVVVSVPAGFGLQTRKIRAGARFGETLAPDFFSAENFGDEAFLLHFRAIRNDGRSNDP